MADTDQTPGETLEPPSQTSAAGRIRNYFLTGLVVAGPVLITAYLTWSFITWVDNLVRPFIPPITGRKLICRGRCRAPGW